MNGNSHNWSDGQREQLTGEDREQLLNKVYETTPFRKLDQNIRERGYNETQSIVQRGIRSEDPFDLYQVTQFYQMDSNQATATWIGLHPTKRERGEVSYDMIEMLDSIDPSTDRTDESRFPVIVGFLDNEDISLRATSDGIEENAMDMNILADAVEKNDADSTDS